MRRRALALAARVVEQRLNADTSDQAGPTLPCACGSETHYAGRRRKTITTVLGNLTLERAYYHCAVCQGGFYPRDRALGFQGTSLSPAVTRMIGLTASLVSFAESSELLQDLAGVGIGAKQVERTAEGLGREIVHDERTVLDPDPPVAPTLYLGMDGTGVPMRACEVEGRRGKQSDGSARTREVKLVTVWSAEGRDPEGLPVRDPGSVTYTAAIESASGRDTDPTSSAFAQRADREAQRRGFDHVKRRVVIGDGAPWIWNLADELFPDAIQIVDLFHAKQHLSDLAKALFGPDNPLGREWARRRHLELDEGRMGTLLKAIRRYADTHDAARKCLDYLTRNQTRMRYTHFRAQGLCVSSGVVEAGVKVAIGTRLKRAGMHWTVAGANAIIALRCCKLSGRFPNFWVRRSVRMKAAA